MEVSYLKWNLFRFVTGSCITYGQNQHIVSSLLKATKWLFIHIRFAAVLFSLSLCDFALCLTACKINSLTSAAPAACWIILCFSCDFEAWTEIKARLIWSRQEYLCAIHCCFHKTWRLWDELILLQLCVCFSLASQFYKYLAKFGN